MKKGLKPLIVGIVFFVIGVFVVPLAIILPLVLSDSQEAKFLIPGTVEFSAEEAGRYYLWNEHQTIFEGRTYNRSADLPDGLSIAIENSDGQAFGFISDASISSSRGSHASQSIGYVDLSKPDLLTVRVSGDVEPQVFSFAQSKLLKIIALIFGGVGLSLIFGAAGVIIGLIGIVKLAQGDNRA